MSAHRPEMLGLRGGLLMNLTPTDLTPRLRAAADYITAHGWTQGRERNDGSVCLMGAIRLCAPVDGDVFLIREVLRRRGRAAAWNDSPDRRVDDVVGFLRTAEITDADLAETFGPQWEPFVALVRRAAALSSDEADSLAAGRTRDAAWVAAWVAARDAARVAARVAAWDAARVAAWDAARALSVRDLIGWHGFTQEHYDTLTGPWAKVIGPVHPDDERVTA